MRRWRIPICDPRPPAELRAEIERRIREVLERGWFILGQEVRAFEEEFAAYLGAAHVVGVGSGTEALHLALAAEGIGPGDDVLTSALTAAPTACAIALAGARPIFADVDPATGLLDPRDAARRMTARTRAIVPVHLYGQCAPIEPLLELARSHGVGLIEDAAQAHGASRRGRRAGTFGDYGCFSFYPTKNLSACGDGGAVATSDPERAERLRRMRNYGQADRYRHVIRGWNSRLDEIQAAILRLKLPRLEQWNERRRRLARIYRRRLGGLGIQLLAEDREGEAVHHLFVIRAPGRDRLRDGLERRGIETQIHYPIPVHLQEAFAHLGGRPGDFPAAERLAQEVLTLPLHPQMSSDQVEEVCATIADLLREG